MERAGISRRKRPNVWQIPAIPRYNEYANTSPSKNAVFEKRRLSLRSENSATITETTATAIATTTPQSSSSLSRVGTGLSQKQPGKENESPFFIQDHTGGKLQAAITNFKSTIKRKKSSNHINSYSITDSENKIIRRRLSGDYDEQLSTSKKLHRANPIEPIVLPCKVLQTALEADVTNRHDLTSKFSVYDDTADGDTAGRDVNEATFGSRDISENGPSTIPRNLYSLWKSYQSYKSHEDDRASSISESVEEKVKIKKSPVIRPEFLDSRTALQGQKISDVEFRIERVDYKGTDGSRTPAMISNCRRVKSGSDIGRLKVPLRTGEDISPLKRRINQLKRSARIAGRRCQAGTCTNSVTKVNASDSKIGLKSIEEVKKLRESMASCSDRGENGKYDLQKSSMDPSTGAIKKTNHYSIILSVEDQREKSVIATDVIKSLPSSTRKESTGDDHPLSEQSRKSCSSPSTAGGQREQRRLNAIVNENPVPRFCQPSLRDRSSDLKDDYIEFVYDDSVGNRQGKLKSTTDFFQNYSPLCNLVYHPITDPAVATVPQGSNEQHESAKGKPAFAGCSWTKADAAELSIGFEINGDSKFKLYREISNYTDSGERDKKFSDKSAHNAVAKFKDTFESPSTTGITRAEMQTVTRRQPTVVTNRDGYRKITRGGGVVKDRAQWPFRNRTLANITAVTTPTFHPGGSSHLIPVIDARKVRPNRKIGTDPESRTIKSAGKISGLFHDIPLEVQYTTDYTKETINIENAREGYCYKISQTFLKGRAVTPEQRRIVVNFLISVHAYLLTSPSTLYQATKIFDAILDIKDVSVTELQLIALGALWIAIKNMETRTPSASEMISFAKDMYDAQGPGLLCKCERKILKTLGFNIRFPDPFYISAYYLRQWSSLGIISNEPSILKTIYHCAGYLMDVALLDENYSGMPCELLAAAATRTAVHLVVLNTSWEHSPWNNDKFTRYTQEEIDRIVEPLLKGVLDSAEKNSPISAVYKKYKNVRYDNTSDYLVVKIKKLPELSRRKYN